MKVCLGQINTTPGDFEGNFRRICNGIDAAVRDDARMVVFPELSIPGYLSQDLMYHPGFVDRNLSVLEALCEYALQHAPLLFVVVGYIDRNHQAGKPFRNMAAVIHDGHLLATYQKQLLPFYDVFDELRYFEPGSDEVVVEIDERRVGIAICEDLWNDKGQDNYTAGSNPLDRYRDLGVDLVVSLNSSPYVEGKCRERIVNVTPDKKDFAIVYVNQVGGQDELVFDGQSFVLRGDELIYLSQEVFADSFATVSLFSDKPLDTISEVAMQDLLVLGLRDYVRKSGFTQVVLASSGGVDSAVVCALACLAVGPENVHAIRMPSRFSSEHSVSDAKQLHNNLGCSDYEVAIEHEPVVDMLNRQFDRASDSYNAIADENIQARLRDLYVMHFSNAFAAMPLSTGNKTESGCGYYTHFDMNFSYAPIKDLYKFQVVDIARNEEKIPENVWRKAPSAELSAGQTDEESLLPYAILDAIVMAYVEYYVTSFEDFANWCAEMAEVRQVSADQKKLMSWLPAPGASAEYERIVRLIGKMEYKRRQTCPGTKVSKVAFGIGRRIPLVEKWS